MKRFNSSTGIQVEVRQYGADPAVSGMLAWVRMKFTLRTTHEAPLPWLPQHPQFWTQANIGNSTFRDAETQGFQENFDFISGENSAGRKIPMTAPVLMRPNGEEGWFNDFFVPASLFNNKDSIPTSPVVGITPMKNLLVATTGFGGFATEAEFQTTTVALLKAVAEAGYDVVPDAFEQVWAQYDSPFTLFNRHNEVWVHVAPAA